MWIAAIVIGCLILIGIVSFIIIRCCFREGGSGEVRHRHRHRHRVRRPRDRAEGNYADIPSGVTGEEQGAPAGGLVALDESDQGSELKGGGGRALDIEAPQAPIPIDRPGRGAKV
jgi:hypothetical protein